MDDRSPALKKFGARPDSDLYYYVAPAAMSGVSTPVIIGLSLELTALRLVSNRNVRLTLYHSV